MKLVYRTLKYYRYSSGDFFRYAVYKYKVQIYMCVLFPELHQSVDEITYKYVKYAQLFC